MINRLTYYLLVFVAVLAAACSHIDEMESPVPDQNLVMRFDMGCDTKVSNDDITSQEFIVYDYIYGASSEGYSDGTCYIDGSKVTLKYMDGSWGFYPKDSDTRVDFLWTETGEHRFYAFNKVEYPFYGYYYQNSFEYNAGNPFIRMGVASLNLTNSDHKKDVVYSSHLRSIDGSANQYSPITLEFKHLFATLSFDIQNTSDETKEITKFSITDFNITSEAAAQMSFTDDLSVTLSSDTGEYQSSLPSEPIQPGDSWDAFDGVPVFVWPQELTPYTEPYVRFTVNGVDYNLRLCEEFSASRWESGKHYHYTIVLSTATPIITLQPPTTTITHTRSIDGVLTGSEVQVVLKNEDGQPLSDSDCARIKNIQIQVKKGDTVYKTYSSSSITSDTIIFFGDPAQGDNKYYLPKGDGYSVEVTYDGLTEPILGTATSLEPTGLTYTVTANAETPGKLTVTDASVNISQSVLDELPLSEISLKFKIDDNNYYEVDEISPVSLGADFTPVETVAVAGVYNLTSSVTFDGIELSITPYTVVNPGVGWYVNIDGTFSETFISSSSNASGYSIARIFYLGLPSSDTQLVADYPDCTRGLAYEVDSSGNLQVNTGKQWSYSMFTDYGFEYKQYDEYGYTTVRRGYTNTVAIKNKKTTAEVMANYGTETSAYTSTWFMPSYQEYLDIYNDNEAKTIIDNKITEDGAYDYGFMVSTLNTESTTVYGQYVSKSGILTKNERTDTNRHYIRILAF